VCSESFGTPPTTPLTPFDELALKRHRFVSNLVDAANSAIENNEIRYDQLEAFDFSAPRIIAFENIQRQSCSSTSTVETNSNSLISVAIYLILLI
jgi:hypothetical protein